MARKSYIRGEIADRFWPKVQKNASGCWLWQSTIQPNGYGHFRINTSKKDYAHRVAYRLLIGPTPEGCDLDHTCRVRHCVNPDHLEPVTRRENLLRGTTHAAKNFYKTHCPAGHEYSVGNTYLYRGARQCVICRKERDKRRRKAGV